MPKSPATVTNLAGLWGPTMVAIALFVPGHMFSWALEWIWLGFQLLVASVFLMIGRRQPKSTAGVPARVWILIFMVITVSGFISALYGYVVLAISPEVADIADLLRFLIFIPLALYVGATVKPWHARAIVRLFKICVVFNLACAVILVFRLSPLDSIVLAVYQDAKVQYDITHVRIGIPFANPNFAALIFALMLSTFLFFERSLVFAFLTVIAIILTGSRSGYLAIAPLILLAYAQFAMKAVQNWRICSAFLLANMGFALLFGATSERLEEVSRLNELIQALQDKDFSQVETASIRFDLMANAFQYIARSPLFGVGPGRSLGLDVVDSQLIAWPLYYGIPIALVLYGLFLAPMLILAWRARKPGHKLAAIATSLCFFLMLGTGDFMRNYRLFFIALVIMHCIHFLALRSNSSMWSGPHFDRTPG